MKLEDQLCFALFAASEAIMRAYRPLFDKAGLTFPQYLALIVLWQHGAKSIDELAAHLRISVAVAALLAEQLQQAGYVAYVRGTAAPNVVTVVLTQTGVQLEHAATEAQRQVFCNSGLTQEGLVSLRRELHEMVDRMADPAIAPQV